MNDEELYLYIKENVAAKKGYGCLILLDLEPNFRLNIFYYVEQEDLLQHLYRAGLDQVYATLEYYDCDLNYYYNGLDFVQKEDLLNHTVHYKCEVRRPSKEKPTLEQLRKEMQELVEYLTKPQIPESDPDVIN